MGSFVTGDTNWDTRTRLLLVLVAIAIIGVLGFVPPIAQNSAYHAFCDTRALLLVPNALNVFSNLPFFVIGVAGLLWLSRRPESLGRDLVPSYAVFFAGLAATAFGSAYYHWAPTDETLFWDRLPIAVAFMGLFTGVLAERVTPAATRLLVPLIIFGGGSVVYWRLTGDLRLYALAKFLPLALIPLILWLYPARWSRGGDVMIALGCYLVAKLFEDWDLAAYDALGKLVSGHTIKHLVAAVGVWWLYRMLTQRDRLPSIEQGRADGHE